jgi:hypothetical protein
MLEKGAKDMKFKGEGRICSVSGRVIAEFINGVAETDDLVTIQILTSQGYVPEVETKPLSSKKSEKE